MKKSLYEVAALIAVIAGGFTYMHANFASASDMNEIKQIVLGNGIQRKMWRYCDNGGANEELKRMIEKERARYRELTGEAMPWVCSP